MMLFVILALVAGLASAQEAATGQLLLVGGSGTAQWKVEVVDLSDPAKVCPVLGDYPDAPFGSSGAFLGGQALVCGGDEDVSTCFTYDGATDLWTEAVPLITGTTWASAVPISDTELWITGGGYFAPSVFTEVYTLGDGSAVDVELPEPKNIHNIVAINATHYVLLGGAQPASSLAWLMDRTTGVWTPLPDLPDPKDSTHAGLVTYPDGHQAVVVTGGRNSKTTEILDVATLTWTLGPDLPVASQLRGGTSVQHGDSFLVVGGAASTAIYRYDPATEDWVTLPQVMSIARGYLTAILVPDDFVACV